MKNTLVFSLEEQRRDALVAYYIGQIATSADTTVPEQVITPEDLYEYLLIDNQVSAQVETSRVAQGIASVQQHIHAIYNGMEPGFGELPDVAQRRESLQFWQDAMSQYSTWAAYQMLVDYPENYLDPSLRIGKTEAFKAFESELAQARLTPDNLQKALGNYLTRFEEVSNLATLSCYIDGVDFRHANYYFVGRQPVEPFDYYWRKAAIDLNQTSTHVPPAAWSEWQQIDAPLGAIATHVRAVVVEGRLYLVWLEQVREALDEKDVPIADRYLYRLNTSYLQSNGQWSVPIALQECSMPSLATLEAAHYTLVSTLDTRLANEPRLVVGFITRTITLPEFAFIHVRDKRWQAVTLGSESKLSLVVALVKQMGTNPGRAQHSIEGADTNQKVWTLESVVWNKSGDNHAGPLSDYLELDARIKTIDGVCKLETVGVCSKPRYQGSDSTAPLRGEFGLWKSQPRSPYALLLNGSARTAVQVDPWGAGDAFPMRFGMSDTTTGLGYNEFTITRKERSNEVPTLVATSDGGQFLDLQALGITPLRYVRLNTAFAGELVRKAERSLQGALGWETQHTPESPAPGSSTATPVDFNGANGRYFWELFFHAPHLAASRLHQSFDYAGTEQWLHYLFNPQVRVAPLYPPPEHVNWLPYWTSRPLGFVDDRSRDLAGPQDPGTIAYGAPSHYRKAIFMLYVDNLIAWGDSLYRQVTRDALTEAKLLYVRALSLLGPLSKGRSISQWAPQSLANAARYQTASFATFEASVADSLQHDTSYALNDQPWLRLIDAPWFRLPVNTRLLDLWEQLDLRLYNLRHNLTLDGKPMLLGLYEAPSNPLDLLRAQLAGNSMSLRRLGSMSIIPPYRFAAMLPRAREAVNTLIRFGEQVRLQMAARDRAAQDRLQQRHVLELSGFVETLDDLAIEQGDLAINALRDSHLQVNRQVATYDTWLKQDVSEAELRAEEMFGTARDARLEAGDDYRARGHGVTAAPNLITLQPVPFPPFIIPIPGGFNWAGPEFQQASKAEGGQINYTENAEVQLRADGYKRRRQEWQFLKDQAQAQLNVLVIQAGQQELVNISAKRKRLRSQQAREHAQALYAFIEKRDTNTALYQWLLGQMSTLYFQAYDAVLSLCLASEACWQYEIGDSDTRFIPVNAWVDDRHGLSSGESLSLGLLQMESAFVVRHERRLELVKTVSLRQLLQDYSGLSDESGWAAVIASLRSTGTLEFALKPSLFDQDYPGHYLRQLVQVSMSLPGVLGLYENSRVMLGQLASSYLLKPDLGGCKHMYRQANELPDEHDDISPRFVIANPRPSQQVAVSGGSDDPGLHFAQMEDARYLPFEGTGAVSTWTLSFPRYASALQQELFDRLQEKDIIVHLRYRAMDGGKPFAAQVKALQQDAAKTSTTLTRRRPGDGVSLHA
ncbi:hypothetical protein AUC61_18490 [Pseudomonas sp. S25]|uniref:Insecticidal toxin complex protein TcaB2 n=1 Tax=Pseudomonas maioricensis TaxID=1766623 RepID=A0ABS9ZMJ0_9PSED|nr:neuraminidase-like domain-containing protein [Pseudomonas sp. S25]MCI8211521.1 hypothetical protein [Pseudomonas sp. S25]